jgi:hypothetical protein
MDHSSNYGTEWVNGFFLFVGVLWIVGALAVFAVSSMGAGRLGEVGVTPASNQTPVANSPETQ